MKLYFIVFLLFVSTLLQAKPLKINFNKPDTVPFNYVQKKKNKPNLYIDFYTGAYQNKLFGFHPILGANAAIFLNKNAFKVIYEFRLGKSTNQYLIMNDNKVLEYTNKFNSEYFGLNMTGCFTQVNTIE